MPPEQNPAVRRALTGLAAVAVGAAQVRADEPTWTLAPPTFAAPQPLPPPAALPDVPAIPAAIVAAPPAAELAPPPRPVFDRELAPMPRLIPGEPPLVVVPVMATPSAATPPPQPLQPDVPVVQGPPIQPELSLPPAEGRPSLSSSPAAPRAPELDETPAMTPAFKSIPAALLGAALAASPMSAQTPPDPAKDAAKAPEAVESLKKQLDEANRRLADQDKELKSLRLELTGGKTEAGIPVKGLRDTLKDFEAKFEKLQTQYSELAGKVAQSGSTSNSNYTPDPKIPQQMPGGAVTPNPATSPAAKPKAKIQIRNYYAAEVTLVLNDVSFKVRPSETREVEINAGDYSYELAGSARETKFVAAGDTMVLSIR